jgi:predicted Ser/Thr protein kinase
LFFFAGGYNSSSYNASIGYVWSTIDIYDVTSNTWALAALSQARDYLAATSVANRYALFAGGINVSDFTNVVDIYDSSNRAWSTATLNQARAAIAATSLGNLAFFAGGLGVNQASNVVDIFNATSQTWSTATLSQPRFFLAAASVEDIVAFGGGYNGSTHFSVVDIYSVTNNIWFTACLNQARAGLAAASSINQILFGGGGSRLGASDSVDIFTFLPSTSPISVPFGSPQPFASPITGTPQSSGFPVAAMIGLAVGIVALIIALIILLLVLLLKRRKKSKSNSPSDGQPQIQQAQPWQQEQRQPLQVTHSIQLSPLNRSSQPYTAQTRDSFTEMSLVTTFTNSTIKRSQIPFSDIVVEKELAEGSLGRVCYGQWKHAPVALKFCRNKKGINDFLREIQILFELPPHPNVVQMFGVSMDESQPVLVMEYCAGGSLAEFLFETHPKMTEQEMISMARGIAAGMLHLHRNNIIHRDLAARNILLSHASGNGVPKITDFGMSRLVEAENIGHTNSNIGPVFWMAPESISNRIYSKKSDVWSYGIVLYEIVAQSEPHKDKDVIEVAVAIRDNAMTPSIPSDCPPFLRELMELCWNKDPEKRPSFEDICEMFQKYLNTRSTSSNTG